MPNVQYMKATLADHDELLDLANYVFKLDFKALLPKLYKPEYQTAPCHYIVKEDGRIKSVIGSFPMELNVCGEPLKVRGIGTVSVHPYARHNGYMKALMIAAMEDMRRDGIDLACLGGARQRYAYFSFEPCGPMLSFRVEAANLRHTFAGAPAPALEARKLEPDDALLPALRALHDAEAVHVTRSPERFYDILCSWNSTPYALLERGEPVGYFAAEPGGSTVGELVLADENRTLEAVRAIFAAFDQRVTTFFCGPWQKGQIAQLESLAERYGVEQNSNFSVLNYAPVLRAMMKLKTTYSTLADGELTLRAGDQAVRIAVDDGVPTVEPFDGPCRVELPHLQAMRFLFSPAAQYVDFGAELPPAVKAWFPLPLYFPKQDNV